MVTTSASRRRVGHSRSVMEGNRVKRKEAVAIGDALKLFLIQSRLAMPHNTQRIFYAWDVVSGAAPFTLKRFFRDGKLFVTLSSSAVRSQLSFQKDVLLEKINAALETDEMFIKGEETPVKELILK